MYQWIPFNTVYIDTPAKLQKYITRNASLEQSRFWTGRNPVVALSKEGNNFVTSGFVPKNTEVKIRRPEIDQSNRMKIIKVDTRGKKSMGSSKQIGD